LGRQLLTSRWRHEVVGVSLLSFAAVFAITTLQFAISPTGYLTLFGTPILIISETALLASAYVLLAGAYLHHRPVIAIVGWALSSAFMIVIDFVSGRRTGLAMIAAAVIALTVITGRKSLRLLGALVPTTLTLFALGVFLAPNSIRGGSDTVGITIESLTGTLPSAAPSGSTLASARPTASPTKTDLSPAPSSPSIDPSATGVETRAGELTNVLTTLRARDGLWVGLGFGRVWEVFQPQPDDFFAVGPRSGLYGTPYRFNIHVPGLDYIFRFGILGTIALALTAAGSILLVLTWPRNGSDRTLALAALLAALLMFSFWGNPRTSFIEGLLLSLVRMAEPERYTYSARSFLRAVTSLPRRHGVNAR
jgi:hypothetical protein